MTHEHGTSTVDQCGEVSRVERCINEAMRRHPGASPASNARFYEAVHQDLAPLARILEADSQRMQSALENIRLYAARHRREEWARTVLRFCDEGGVSATILRSAMVGDRDAT